MKALRIALPLLLIVALLLAPLSAHAAPIDQCFTTTTANQVSVSWPNSADCFGVTSFSGNNCGTSNPHMEIHGDLLSSTATGADDNLYVRFNGDSGAHYTYLSDQKYDNSTAEGYYVDGQASFTQGLIGTIPAAGGTSGATGSTTVKINFAGYPGSHFRWEVDSAWLNQGTMNVLLVDGVWTNPTPANAITNITMFVGASFAAGGKFSLFCY